MLKILVSVISLLPAILPFTHAQNFPDGVYLTLEQLNNRTPAFQANLVIDKRKEGEITMNGGNDYKLESLSDSLNPNYIKNDIFAYVKNDSLVLNGRFHKLQKWFALALTQGNFIMFNAAISSGDAATIAVLGGALASAVAANDRKLYILSLRTGNVREMSKEYLEERLKDYPYLQEQFNSEMNKDAEETWIKYIQLINKSLEEAALNKE